MKENFIDKTTNIKLGCNNIVMKFSYNNVYHKTHVYETYRYNRKYCVVTYLYIH